MQERIFRFALAPAKLKSVIADNHAYTTMTNPPQKLRAERNRTITLTADEEAFYRAKLVKLSGQAEAQALENTTINQDLLAVLDWLPTSSVDLLFIDPPYNLTKSFNGALFRVC